MEYHDELSKISCVANGDEEQFLACLETIISRLKINENENFDFKIYNKNFYQSHCD